MRHTARLLMQFLPGTDLVCSGFSAVPNYDNMFAGSNVDTDDYDDWNVIQRDLKVDGGLRHLPDEQILAIPNKAARALQAMFEQLGFAPITDEEVEAATYAHGSEDLPRRAVLEDLKAAQAMDERGITGIDAGPRSAGPGRTRSSLRSHRRSASPSRGRSWACRWRTSSARSWPASRRRASGRG